MTGHGPGGLRSCANRSFREFPQLVRESVLARRSEVRLGVRDAFVAHPDPAACRYRHDRDVMNPTAIWRAEPDPPRRFPDQEQHGGFRAGSKPQRDAAL